MALPFVTPLGADAFSLLGVRNISRWIESWVEYYDLGIQQAARFNDDIFNRYSIEKNVKIKDGYIGYTLQQYIAKSKEGVRRPTKAYERILNDVPEEVNSYLKKFTTSKQDLRLGDVPNLYSLIPLAQTVNSPIIGLKAKDGLVGSQFSQATTYKDIIGSLALAIAKRIK